MGGRVVWLYGSERLQEMKVLRGREGEGCLVECVKYMRGGGLSTPSGLRINVKMTFTRN